MYLQSVAVRHTRTDGPAQHNKVSLRCTVRTASNVVVLQLPASEVQVQRTSERGRRQGDIIRKRHAHSTMA